jgi:hypothetical protein
MKPKAGYIFAKSRSERGTGTNWKRTISGLDYKTRYKSQGHSTGVMS